MVSKKDIRDHRQHNSSVSVLFWQISFRVRKRFPTLDHLIELGLLRPDELKIMDILNEKALVKKWWMPLVWATHIVEKARRFVLIYTYR